jgi:hypothetical protein
VGGSSLDQSNLSCDRGPGSHSTFLGLVGDGIFDDIHQTNFQPKTLNKAELQMLRDTIKSTVRPRWQACPPLNFGEPSHGKLTADQWRTLMEFDLPVSLAKSLRNKSRLTPSGDRLNKLFESTLLLAIAIAWGTSRRVSIKSKDNYVLCMQKYLQTVLDFKPGSTLLPNHHSSLHFGAYLEHYGPAHGWWAFPFERIVGLLQRINTNGKIGMFQLVFL